MASAMEGETVGDRRLRLEWGAKAAPALWPLLRASHTKGWRMLGWRVSSSIQPQTADSEIGSRPHQQFTNTNRLKASIAQRGLPVISADAKKRELLGLFKNQSRGWPTAPVMSTCVTFGRLQGDCYGTYNVTFGFIVVGTSYNRAPRRQDTGSIVELVGDCFDSVANRS